MSDIESTFLRIRVGQRYGKNYSWVVEGIYAGDLEGDSREGPFVERSRVSSSTSTGKRCNFLYPLLPYDSRVFGVRLSDAHKCAETERNDERSNPS